MGDSSIVAIAPIQVMCFTLSMANISIWGEAITRPTPSLLGATIDYMLDIVFTLPIYFIA